MKNQDLAWILNRFDDFNDSIVMSITVDNSLAPRCDIIIRLIVHDSESDFSSKYITLRLVDVAEMKLVKVENVTSFLLSFGATFVFKDGFYYIELGGNGEQNSIDEMKDGDIFIKFRRCELSEILETGTS